MTKTDVPSVYMDACCFIDLAKPILKMPTPPGRGPHMHFCKKFIEAARAGHAHVYTSTISVVECVKVTDKTTSGGPTVEDDRVKALFRGMLMSAKSGVLPVMPSPAITEAARDLRWVHSITCQPLDQLHIATALAMKCSHFFTTDGKLGFENVKKIAALGLIVTTAESVFKLLPSEYHQYELSDANHAKQQGAQA